MREIEECFIHFSGILQKYIGIPKIKEHLSLLYLKKGGKPWLCEKITVCKGGIIGEHADSHQSASHHENFTTHIGMIYSIPGYSTIIFALPGILRKIMVGKPKG